MRGGTVGRGIGSDPLSSALALLVARVLADDVDLAPAANDLAVLADPLDAGSNLHRTSYSLSINNRAGPHAGPRDRVGPPRRPSHPVARPSRFGPNSANIHQ